MEGMNFAVIGSAHGHIRSFIKDMLEHNGNFKAIYNDKSDLAEELAAEYGVPLVNNMRKIFDQNIEIAGTSAVNNKKIDIIEKCNQHGVHLIADKPIVVNGKQYNRLENILEEGKIEIGLMLTVRFMPEIRKLKEIIDKKIIGDLLSVEILSPHTLRPETRPDWHFDREKSGGIIIDLMIHSVDLYHWLTQDDIINFSGTVQKSILKDKEGFYDNAQVFVKNEKGTSGYFRVDWHMTESHWSWGDLRIFCTGAKGMLEARVLGDPLKREPQLILFEKGKKTRQVKVEKPAKLSVTEDFLNRIQEKDYIIGHQDILQATGSTIEFDRELKRIDMT